MDDDWGYSHLWYNSGGDHVHVFVPSIMLICCVAASQDNDSDMSWYFSTAAGEIEPTNQPTRVLSKKPGEIADMFPGIWPTSAPATRRGSSYQRILMGVPLWLLMGVYPIGIVAPTSMTFFPYRVKPHHTVARCPNGWRLNMNNFLRLQILTHTPLVI